MFLEVPLAVVRTRKFCDFPGEKGRKDSKSSHCRVLTHKCHVHKYTCLTNAGLRISGTHAFNKHKHLLMFPHQGACLPHITETFHAPLLRTLTYLHAYFI